MENKSVFYGTKMKMLKSCFFDMCVCCGFLLASVFFGRMVIVILTKDPFHHGIHYYFWWSGFTFYHLKRVSKVVTQQNA